MNESGTPGSGEPSSGSPGQGEQSRQDNEKPVQPADISEEAVDKTRAWTGLYVVVGGDIAIATAAIVALLTFTSSGVSSNGSVLASILSSAFTAIGTMTTAYFGIRSSSNTAQKSIKHLSGRA